MLAHQEFPLNFLLLLTVTREKRVRVSVCVLCIRFLSSFALHTDEQKNSKQYTAFEAFLTIKQHAELIYHSFEATKILLLAKWRCICKYESECVSMHFRIQYLSTTRVVRFYPDCFFFLHFIYSFRDTYGFNIVFILSLFCYFVHFVVVYWYYCSHLAQRVCERFLVVALASGKNM